MMDVISIRSNLSFLRAVRCAASCSVVMPSVVDVVLWWNGISLVAGVVW